jgi:hypothetical protein
MKRLICATTVSFVLLFGAGNGAGAQSQSNDYELTGSVVASGSAISGGAYTVDGAVGQPDTGTLSGGDYSLGGGFFGGGVITGGSKQAVYLPLMRH